MKSILFFLLFSCILSNAQNPEDLFREANNSYNKGDYDRAIIYYDSIIKSGLHSAELYFNLGNAYYKKNAIAFSILNYEKALLLDSNYDQAINNLSFAQNMTLDRFTPLPEGQFISAVNSLMFFTSVRKWSFVTIGLFWLSLALFFLYLKSVNSFQKRVFFGAFIIFLTCTFLSLLAILQQKSELHNTKPAIVFAQLESFRAEPNLRAEVLLTIHEGAKVYIEESVENWVKIRLQNGSVGWMPRGSLKLISFVE